METNKKLGFTLIEVLIVIGILAILAGIVLVAINPGHQFAQARDTQRASAIHAILNAVGQNMAENRGIFTCNGVEKEILTSQDDNGLPTTVIKSGSSQVEIDLYDCLVPKYIAEMPIDPKDGHLKDKTDYNTGYYIGKTGAEEGNRIIIYARSAEIDENIPMKVVR